MDKWAVQDFQDKTETEDLQDHRDPKEVLGTGVLKGPQDLLEV
jgi:hypothetical protein